jgi:hypothetical protein
MELGKEFIEANGLNEDQVKAITDYTNDLTANIKNEYSSLANKNTDGILSGVAKSMGFEVEREEGEKWNDYITRISTQKFSDKEAELNTLKTSLEEKIANTKGNEVLSKEYEDLKQKFDNAQKTLAEYEPFVEKGRGYDDVFGELEQMKRENAFSTIHVSIPDSLSENEKELFSYKYKEWKKEVLSKYEIKNVDGDYIAVDKENQYKTTDLKKLFTENESIQGLLKGRQQEGSNTKSKTLLEIKDLPFKLPKDANKEDLRKAARAHLMGEGLSVTSPQYPKKFQEIFNKGKEALGLV